MQNVGEHETQIATFTPEDPRLVIIPMRLYSELFGDIDAGRSDGGDLAERTTKPLDKLKEAEPILPISDELQTGRPNDTDAHT
jgi:hypothetical protein